MFEVVSDPEERRHFSRAQDDRQLLLVPGIRNVFDHPVSVEGVVIEEAQCAYGLVEDRPRHLFVLDQKQLVLPDVFRAQPIRRGTKVLGEVSHATDVGE